MRRFRRPIRNDPDELSSGSSYCLPAGGRQAVGRSRTNRNAEAEWAAPGQRDWWRKTGGSVRQAVRPTCRTDLLLRRLRFAGKRTQILIRHISKTGCAAGKIGQGAQPAL